MRIPFSISVFDHHRPSHVSSAIVQSNFHVHEHDILKIEGAYPYEAGPSLLNRRAANTFTIFLGRLQWRSLSRLKWLAIPSDINVVSAGLPCAVGSNANTSKPRHIQVGKCSS